MHPILKDSIKKALRPCGQRELVKGIINDKGLSITRACAIVRLSRSMWYYRSQRDDSGVVGKLTDAPLKDHFV